MKNVLFVINTLGRAGAETSLIELLHRMDPQRYNVSVYVLMNQGEKVNQIPPYVRLLNRNYRDCSVFTPGGRFQLAKHLLRQMFRRNAFWKNFGFLCGYFTKMVLNGKILWDKLLWRVISDSAEVFLEEYDLAVAFLEGGSTYYVADHVKAKNKVAFVHIDYAQAGYNRKMDKGCYGEMDQIFTVSEETRNAFLKVYPEYEERVSVFNNIINWDQIRIMAQQAGGFMDGYAGIRLLTVARLTNQKALDISVQAMKLLKDQGVNARWYVIGEGEERKSLTKLIRKLELEEDFILLGSIENPYPYYQQADVYVHASRHEGKSIAVQEAMFLGCPVVLSDCNGNREQIIDGVDGAMCDLTPDSIADHIKVLINDKKLRECYSKAAAARIISCDKQMEMLLQYCNREQSL